MWRPCHTPLQIHVLTSHITKFFWCKEKWGKKCVSYKTTAKYDVPKRQDVRPPPLLLRRNSRNAARVCGIHASGRKLRTRNKNNPAPFAKFSKL